MEKVKTSQHLYPKDSIHTYLAAVLFEHLVAARLEAAHRVDHLFRQLERRLHWFRVAPENVAEINVHLKAAKTRE